MINTTKQLDDARGYSGAAKMAVDQLRKAYPNVAALGTAHMMLENLASVLKLARTELLPDEEAMDVPPDEAAWGEMEEEMIRHQDDVPDPDMPF